MSCSHWSAQGDFYANSRYGENIDPQGQSRVPPRHSAPKEAAKRGPTERDANVPNKPRPPPHPQDTRKTNPDPEGRFSKPSSNDHARGSSKDREGRSSKPSSHAQARGNSEEHARRGQSEDRYSSSRFSHPTESSKVCDVTARIHPFNSQLVSHVSPLCESIN